MGEVPSPLPGNAGLPMLKSKRAQIVLVVRVLANENSPRSVDNPVTMLLLGVHFGQEPEGDVVVDVVAVIEACRRVPTQNEVDRLAETERASQSHWLFAGIA